MTRSPDVAELQAKRCIEAPCKQRFRFRVLGFQGLRVDLGFGVQGSGFRFRVLAF